MKPKKPRPPSAREIAYMYVQKFPHILKNKTEDYYLKCDLECLVEDAIKYDRRCRKGKKQ